MSRNRVSLSQDRETRLREFWPLGQPIKYLAAEWGCTVGYVSTQAKELGLPSRQTTSVVRRIRSLQHFQIKIESRRYFEEASSRRGMHPRELESLLIATICNDRLVDAILDDAREEAA